MAVAKQISREIYNVFKAVEEVIPGLVEYHLGAKDPSWLPLEKSGFVSMRDHILIKCAETQHQQVELDKDLLLTCALSFDVVSRATHFDVDHFFPQSLMMRNLDKLFEDQSLLKNIKKELFNLLKENKKKQEKADEKAAQKYANSVVDKLIPLIILPSNNSKQLQVTGLRHIYYNYPANLWPISGPVNRTKGRKESIESAISFVFTRIDELLGKKHLNTLAIKTAKYLDDIKVNQINMDTEDNKKTTLKLFSKAILKKFDDNCNISNITKDKSILPYYIDDQGTHISMLSFFQGTPIGKISSKFSKETAVNAKQAFSIARNIAYHVMAQELITDDKKLQKLKSVSKGAKRLIKIFCRSLKDELNRSIIEYSPSAPLPVYSSSDSEMGSNDPKIVAEVIETIAERTHTAANKAAKRLRETIPNSQEPSRKRHKAILAGV